MKDRMELAAERVHNIKDEDAQEILSTMNELQADIYRGYSMDDCDKYLWREMVAELKRRGFVIRNKPVRNSWGRRVGTIWSAVPQSEAVKRTRHFTAELKKVNMRPDDGRPTCDGDCTTRSMAYCLRGILTYREIESEQYRLAERKNAERGLVHGDGRKKYRRNTMGTWDEIMQSRGYTWLHLEKKVRRDNLAAALREMPYPIITRSSGHVAVVESGAVVDSWDSRHGRCSMILVKSGDIVAVGELLMKSKIGIFVDWRKNHFPH